MDESCLDVSIVILSQYAQEKSRHEADFVGRGLE